MRRLAFGQIVWRAANSATQVRWLGLVGSVAAISLAALCFVRIAPGDGSPLSELKPEVAYSVPVDSDHASFDLNFEPKTRYIVVVGSLGPADGRFAVDCSSGGVAGPSRRPFAQILPLGTSPKVDISAVEPTRDLRRDVIPVRLATPALNAAKGPARTLTAVGSREFSLHVTDGTLDDPAQYATIHANNIAEGREVRVYLDDQQAPSALPPGLVRDIVELFDGEIIPRFRRLLGTYRDVDHDGRFAILLSPWLGRLQGGRTSVGGFVRGSDFQTCLGLPFSNRCDMMYVNSQTVPGPHLRTLLIHEYTHAICFSRRSGDMVGRPRFPDEEDWVNEAIAHCAESLFQGGWSNLDYRISRYLSDTASFPLVVGDYYRAGLWRCHGCRGATYLFLRHCLEKFGPETLSRLITGPSAGTHNIELATGCPFDQLFRSWTLSLIETANHEAVQTTTDSSGSAGARPALAGLDLCGRLGNWGLAGSRHQIWDVDGQARRVELRGTSAAYLELTASGASGLRRVCLEASPGSKMQVSVVRLNDAAPRIEVAAMWTTNRASADGRSGNGIDSSSSVQRPSFDCLHTIVRTDGEVEVTIQQISAEQNSAETHSSVCFPSTALAEIETDPQTEDAESTASAWRDRAFDLPATHIASGDVPIVIKVVAVDGRGHRISGWTVVDPHTKLQTERLAQKVP